MYKSIYVVIPGTGHVVEVLGDFFLPNLPPTHIRFSSTDQFCSPKRLRLRRRRRLASSGLGHPAHTPQAASAGAATVAETCAGPKPAFAAKKAM